MNSINNIQQFDINYPKLNFIDKPSHLICGICKEIYRNPHQTPCGCRFCLSCLQVYLKDKLNKCPANTEECRFISINDLTFDPAINKEVMRLKVDCPHESCSEIKILKEIIDHVDECIYRMVSCSKCKKKDQFYNIKNHDDYECPKREYKCTYCSMIMTYEYYTSEHLNPDSDDLCENYSIAECPNKCSIKGRIDNLREHLKICTNAKQKCPLTLSNCSKYKFNDEELKKHFDENLLKHNQYLMKNQLELELKNKELETKNEILEKSIEELRLHNTTIVEELKFQKMEIQNILQSLNLKNNRNNLDSENNRHSKKIFHNGTFIWKITEFVAKKRNAESGSQISFTSDPFYTSEFGYKMCLKLYPAGDGVGRNSHISVFFVIVKGEYDDILSWPFKKKVILELLDQYGKEKHYTEVFRPDEKSLCYEKPKQNMNVASGAPKFYELNHLINSRFHKNDTIYIKISII